jgi:uncharacterized membrane protein YeaQ/YmgE (transglycosylase-associated protein family)
MGIIAWIILGLLAGVLARLVMPGRQPLGLVGTILLGIVGAVLGGFIGTQMGWGQVHGFDLRSLGLAILGGVLVLFIVGLFQRRAPRGR